QYHIPLIPVAFDMCENAEEMLKQFLMKASQVWREANDVTFAVACSATEHYHLEQAFTTGSMVSQMYVKVKGWGVLSEQDKKWNALSLCLLLNEPVHNKPSYDEDFSLTSRKWPASSVSTAASRRCSKHKLSTAPTYVPLSTYCLLSTLLCAEIRWNVEGTFVGTVTVCDLPSKPTDGSEDNHTLLFKNFLAAPLLTCDGLYEEQKFAGNTDFAPNKDQLGIVIDAYIHHVVVDSGNTVLLSDMQGIVAPDSSVTLFDPQAHT
ncbi:hypothetical protein F5141DRAFT_1007487, partial [Pisolithus sp. B1]